MTDGSAEVSTEADVMNWNQMNVSWEFLELGGRKNCFFTGAKKLLAHYFIDLDITCNAVLLLVRQQYN